MTEVNANTSDAPSTFFGFSTEKTMRILAVLALFLAASLATTRIDAFSFFVYDDTFIFLRYVANFLNHGEIAWNIGDAVEGYSSPLQMLLTIILGSMGMDLLAAARLLNFIAYGGFCLLLFYTLRPRVGAALAVFPAALAFASPTLIAWAWGGMEMLLSVFIIMVGHALMLKAMDDGKARDLRMAAITGLVFALAAFNRLDNLIFGFAAGIVWLSFPGKWDERLKRGLAFGGVIFLLLGVHEIWRYATYGDLLPNTFYAKVPGSPGATFDNGLRYLWAGIKAPALIYPSGILALISLLFYPRTRIFALYALGGMALSAIYILRIGGDYMPGFRFMMPWLPACMLALGLLVGQLEKLWYYAGVLSLLAILHAQFILPLGLRSLDSTALAGVTTGQYVAKNWPKGSLVALNAAGAIAYYNLDKTFIDMMGLSDRTIAKREMPDLGLAWQRVPGHSKGDGAYVLRRQPDFIILSSVAGNSSPETPVFASDAEMQATEEFHRCYKQEHANVPWPADVLRRSRQTDDHYVFSYYRRICAKTASKH